MKGKNSKRFVLIHVSWMCFECVCACAHSTFQMGLRFGWQRRCNIHNRLGECNEVKCHNIPHRSASPQFWQPAYAHRCLVCVCVCTYSMALSWMPVCILFRMEEKGTEVKTSGTTNITQCLFLKREKGAKDPPKGQKNVEMSLLLLLPSARFSSPAVISFRAFFISHFQVSSPSIFSPSLWRWINGKSILLWPSGLTRVISSASEGFQVSLPGSCGQQRQRPTGAGGGVTLACSLTTLSGWDTQAVIINTPQLSLKELHVPLGITFHCTLSPVFKSPSFL